MYIHVADVGDGLCMAVRVGSDVLQVDCGSAQKPNCALCGLKRVWGGCGGPDLFVLSHFHIDHYNGLVLATESLWKWRFAVREVCYPRLPDMDVEEKRELMCGFLAMNRRVLGRRTGLAELDLLSIFRKINSVRFQFRPISRGDRILVDNTPFEVLWPPRQVDQGNRGVIQRALESFRKALEEDEILRQQYDEVRESGLVEPYLDGTATMCEPADDAEEDAGDYRRDLREYRAEELPQSVKAANEGLRRAANHLSIALAQCDNILFMGDLENSDIPQVVDYLGRRRNYFHLLVTPHHGTHWHSDLGNIRCAYSVSSNGTRSHARKKDAFKYISSWSLNTYDCGDILLPACPGGCIPPWKVPYCWACRRRRLPLTRHGEP